MAALSLILPRNCPGLSGTRDSRHRGIEHTSKPKLQLRRIARGGAVHVRPSPAARSTLVVKAKKDEDADVEKTVMMEAEIVSPPPEGQFEGGASAASSGEMEVMPGDYRIGATLLAVSAFLGPVCHLWWPQFFLHGVLGAFLTFQASRVRFRFTNKDLDVVFIEPGAADDTAKDVGTDSSGDNKLQGGGENKWALSSVTNWEFWWPGFPVLVYYKENQTKADGQPHFFPIIMDGKKLYETMLEKMPPSMNEKPSPSDWNLLTALEATPVGRNIIEQLDDQQKAKAKDIKGLPFIDK